MDAVIWVAIVTGTTGLGAALFQLLGSRSTSRQDARGAFEKNLMQRLEKQDDRIAGLEASDSRKDSRIDQLTEWGRWAQEPTPRTPPAWPESPR